MATLKQRIFGGANNILNFFNAFLSPYEFWMVYTCFILSLFSSFLIFFGFDVYFCYMNYDYTYEIFLKNTPYSIYRRNFPGSLIVVVTLWFSMLVFAIKFYRKAEFKLARMYILHFALMPFYIGYVAKISMFLLYVLINFYIPISSFQNMHMIYL